MQRRTLTYMAMVVLGLVTLTASVFGRQEPPVAPQDCKIVRYCTPVPAQAAQRGKERQPAIVGGREVTVRGQDVSIGGEGENGDPALMWRETWKLAPTNQPIDDRGDLTERDAVRRAKGGVVTNPQLEMKVYGQEAKNLMAFNFGGLLNVWTGLSAEPIAIMLRDKVNFANVPRLGRIRVNARTYGLHTLHPVLKLADGSFVVANRSVNTEGEFLWADMTLNDARWFWLDPERILVMHEVYKPDLSRVDEAGVVDLMPSAGHQGGGWSNVGTIEFYANKVPR